MFLAPLQCIQTPSSPASARHTVSQNTKNASRNHTKRHKKGTSASRQATHLVKCSLRLSTLMSDLRQMNSTPISIRFTDLKRLLCFTTPKPRAAVIHHKDFTGVHQLNVTSFTSRRFTPKLLLTHRSGVTVLCTSLLTQDFKYLKFPLVVQKWQIRGKKSLIPALQVSLFP